jgi:predicted transcriptional regulator
VIAEADGVNRRLIGALLRVPYQEGVRYVHRGLAEAGYADIRPAHMAVFQHINEAAGSRLTALAEAAQMTKQSMAYLVEHLEERGYVQRVRDPADGRTLVRAVEDEWAARYLSKRDMKQLRQLLKQLVTGLEGARPRT